MDDKLNALHKLIEAVEAGASDRQDLLHMIDNAMPQDNPACMAMAHQAYHGSLDADHALHEALLPGWGWEVRKAAHDGEGSAYVFPGKMPQDGRQQAAAPTPARAWLLAILRAYRSTQGEAG